MATLDRTRATALVEPHVQRLYNFVFRLTLDRDRAERYVHDIFELAATKLAEQPTEATAASLWLLTLANELLDKRLPPSPRSTSTSSTTPCATRRPAPTSCARVSDPQRDFSVVGAQAGCMTAVVNCLPPGERAAFVTCHVIKLPDDQAAKVLAITESAYKVRLSRARKKIGDYLAPRCEHVNR